MTTLEWTKILIMRFLLWDKLRNRPKKLASLFWTFLLSLLIIVPLSPVQAMTVSPPLIELVVEPGTQLTKEIIVYNETAAPQIITASLAEMDTRSALPWLSLDRESQHMRPTEARTFNLKVSIPASAEPGGYYATVVFTASPEQPKEQGIGIIGSVGSVVFVTVSGKAKLEGQIIDFRTESQAQPALFLSQHPTSFKLIIKNSGTLHFKPQGAIEVGGLFGSINTIPVNVEARSVLPGWERTFDQSWLRSGKRRVDKTGLSGEWQRLGFGRYTANARLAIADKTITREMTYWVFPWRTISIIVGAGLILLIVSSRRR